ncbi:MAG: hypothetical protein ACR2NA_11490 [Solirubrobacterales bacterium]
MDAEPDTLLELDNEKWARLEERRRSASAKNGPWALSRTAALHGELPVDPIPGLDDGAE